jgi:hypothetical protein
MERAEIAAANALAERREQRYDARGCTLLSEIFSKICQLGRQRHDT